MKILAIRGANLASLAREFEIDLAQGALAASGLFAIVGNTGAGKSTLLDAMCVALFDRTPRIGDRARTAVLIGRGGDEATKVGAHDVRSLLRRGAGRGFAEVDFLGNDGRTYRARWEVHRARDKAEGALQTQEMSLLALDQSERLGGTKTETLAAIEERLGLSFDQFRRSALLAQGDFAAFLRADAKDRSELLERMTGTEIYSQLSIAAHRRGQAAEARIKELAALGAAIETLAEPARRELELEAAAAATAHEEARVHHAALERALEWARQLERRRAELAEAERELTSVEEQEALAKALRAEHEQARRAEHLRPAWQAAQHAERQAADRGAFAQGLAEAAQAAREASASAEHAASQLDELLGPARALRQALGAAPVESVAKNELPVEALAQRLAEPMAALEARRHQSGLAAAWPELVAFGEREAKLRHEAAELERKAARLLEDGERLAARRAHLETERQRATHALEEAKRLAAIASGPPGAERLPSVDQAARALDAAQRAVEQAELLAQARAQALAALARCAELDEHRARTAQHLLALDERLATLDAQRPVETAALAQAEAALTRLSAAASLGHTRASLVEGEPCPLCGALEHPWAGGGAFDEVIVEQRAAVAALREAAAATTALRAQLEAERATARATDEAQQLERATAERSAEEAHAQWRACLLELGELALITSPTSPDAAALTKEHATRARRAWERARDERRRVDAFAKAVADAQAAILTKQNDLGITERAIVDAELERQQAEERRLSAARAAAEKRAARAELLTALATRLAPFGIPSDQAVAEPARVLEELRGQVATWRRHLDKLLELEAALARQHQRTSAAAAAARTELAVTEASLVTAQAQRDQARHAAEAARRELAAACQAAELDPAALTGLMAAPPGRVHELGELLAEVGRRGERVRTLVRERQRGLDEHLAAPPPLPSDAAADRELLAFAARGELAASETLAERVRDARQHTGIVEERLVTARSRLARDDADRQRQQGLLAQVVAAEQNAEIDRALAQAIGSHDGKLLRAFAQSLTLDTLLGLANQHLDELAPRYQLERVPRYDLELQVIDRDMGDEVRSVQSLSGGESFLVSLALALALSSLAAGSVRVRTLLIDEGFGTLDASTLDSALAVLDALQATGRQVGIISHIPGLVERVAAHVKVVQRGSGRSEVVVAS